MATYWAELNANNVVTQVITGVDDATIEGIPTGEWYSIFLGKPCVETWIDREDKTYAGLGYEYLESQKDFRPPQPYPSWTWSNKIWNPPTPYPNDGEEYRWSEEDLEWVAI